MAKTRKWQAELLRWLVRLAGTGLLLFFLWRLQLDPAKIWQDLLHANGWWVGLAVLLVFPFIALKAWRWQIILADLGLDLGLPLAFAPAYRLYAVGLAAGSFTPGQAGDAIKAWYLRKRGYAFGLAFVSIVLDRLFDLAVLLLLASAGLLFLGADFVGELPALLLLLLGTLAGVFLLTVPAWRDRLLQLVLKLIVRNQDQKEAFTPETDGKMGPLNLLPVFGATLLGSALALFRVWLLALSLEINLNFLQVVAVSSLATVISLLPVSVSGIGARDVVLVAILEKLGYLREQAVSLSTLILLLNLVNLVVGYAIWFTRPKSEH